MTLNLSFSFQSSIRSVKYTNRLHIQLNSVATTNNLASVIKKGKKKEVAALLNEINDEHYISKYLNHKEYMIGLGKPLMNFYDFTYSKPGTLKIFVEYNKKAKTGFVLGIPPPEVVGDIFRDTTHCAIISMDKRSGGNNYEDFIRITKEQYRARKSQPGPIPIIWNDYIVDNLQIIQAAALGTYLYILYIYCNIRSILILHINYDTIFIYIIYNYTSLLYYTLNTILYYRCCRCRTVSGSSRRPKILN